MGRYSHSCHTFVDWVGICPIYKLCDNISQFFVGSLWSDEGDILLDSPWMETLGSLILNTKNKFLTFSYKKKKITLQDTTSKLDSITPEDFKDISKVILQKSMQNMQKEIDKIIIEKNEEISCLKNHSQNLITRI
jgi:hypothetical protein